MMLTTCTWVPPTWLAMLPQKFSAATTCTTSPAFAAVLELEAEVPHAARTAEPRRSSSIAFTMNGTLDENGSRYKSGRAGRVATVGGCEQAEPVGHRALRIECHAPGCSVRRMKVLADDRSCRRHTG